MDLLSLYWWLCCVAAFLFIVSLLYRIARALEKIARHLREITRAYTKNDRYHGDDV